MIGDNSDPDTGKNAEELRKKLGRVYIPEDEVDQ